MFISVSEIVVIMIVSLLVLNENDCVIIMKKIGTIIQFLKNKYCNIISQIKRFIYDK